MSLLCDACSKPIPPDGRHMTCTSCGHDSHLGKTCSGISEATFTAMTTEKKEKWRCKVCRTKTTRTDLDVGVAGFDTSFQCDSSTLAAQILDMSRKLDSLLSLKTSVDTLLELPQKVNELLLLRPSIQLMKTAVEEVQSSITFLSAKYDDMLAVATAHETAVKDLQAEMSTLKTTVSEQARTIQTLRTEINEADQTSRLNNMEIQGLKVDQNETLASVLMQLADKLAIDGHEPAHVISTHRLPGKQVANPTILVRFASSVIKDRWMQARVKLRTSFGKDSSERVYFNDNLSPMNRELFWLARSRGKECGYKFVWVKHSRIYAKKEEGAPPIRILQRGDLDLIK